MGKTKKPAPKRKTRAPKKPAKPVETPKTGRPPLDIDPDVVENLAQIHCTYEEIAAVCKCSTDTLKRRFADIIDTSRQGGRASLRRVQWSIALMGNTRMLTWLGKQHLEQSDKVETRSTVDTNGFERRFNDLLTDPESADLALQLAEKMNEKK